MKKRTNPIPQILRQTGSNLAKTWPTQIMGLFTVMLAVLIFSFFLLVHLNMLATGARLGEELRLTVYLEREIEPPLMARLEQQIRQFGDIAEVRYTSRQEAFARFAEQLGEERDILDNLGPEFLPPSIEVTPKPSLRSPDDLERLAAHLLTLPDTTRVQYGREWLRRFSAFNRVLQAVVLISGVLLIFNMIFTISHSTRLAMAARREEIEILRLLGASRSYISIPFVAEGLLQGGLGSGLGMAALWLFYQRIGNPVNDPGLLGLFTPSFLPLPVTAGIIVGGTLLCVVSSLLVVNKALRI